MQPGEVVANVRGDARALLEAERTALNFLQRLCGIATLTATFVEIESATPMSTQVKGAVLLSRKEFVREEYGDAAWPSGPALLYNETATLPAAKNTLLPLLDRQRSAAGQACRPVSH